jgi:hypothetical protein
MSLRFIVLTGEPGGKTTPATMPSSIWSPQRRARCTPIGAIPQRIVPKHPRRRCIWTVSCGASGAGIRAMC